jgi:hypothetical protein
MARYWLTYFVKARTTGPLIFFFANGSSPKFFEKKKSDNTLSDLPKF